METIVIKSSTTARALIKSRKFELIDVKPHKNNKDRTVFVFLRTDELMRYICNNSLEV